MDVLQLPYTMAELDKLFPLDKHSGPRPLTELCLKLICENLDIISHEGKKGHRVLRRNLTLPSEICHEIVAYVVKHETVENLDDFFTIFQRVSATKLKRVKIGGRNVTDQSIRILKRHKLVDLRLVNCSDLTEYTIKCVNANSENLRSLVLQGTSVIIIPQNLSAYKKRGYVFKAPNLRHLTAEYLSIPASDYNIFLAGLENLTHLDLSRNLYLSDFSFHRLVPNLVSLILYNVKINLEGQSFISNICCLQNLRHLDISQLSPEDGIFENPNKLLALLASRLENLVSLDIGGTNLAGRNIIECVSDSDVNDETSATLCDIPGLACRTHRPLEFLGLYGTAYAACRRYDIPAKLVAGNANEDQILIAAHICMENKFDLLHKVLNDLYYTLKYGNCHRIDQALCVVLEAMERYPLQKHVQSTGSATLFHILKMKKQEELEVQVKERIIKSLLVAMSIYKDDEIMLRNGILALCQFHVPQDIMSHYETLVKVLVYSLKNAESQSFVQRIGMYLLNILACEVEGAEKCMLGELGCIKGMLELIEYRVKSAIFDDILEVAWCNMWNMTDETPINCKRFLEENGMVLFMKCLEQHPHKEELVRNMMGLLGNVAEVKELRSYLAQPQYVAVFTNLLHLYNDGIEVSYNAAGTLAHMASDGAEAWKIDNPSREDVLKYIVEAIEGWDISAERSINYRSFLPLLRLLDVYHTPECQHWAVWALANLTSVYPNKYCELLVKEGGLEKLNNLKLDSRPYENIKVLARLVCDICCHYDSNTDVVNALQSPLEGEYSFDG